MSKPQDSQRNYHTQLPTGNEVQVLLEKEAKRTIPEAKRAMHFPTFETVQNWLLYLQIDGSFFEQKLNEHEILEKAAQIQENVVTKTLERAETDLKLQEILNMVSDYLGMPDNAEIADLLFVLGGNSLTRIEKAVELWKDNLAPLILVSGKHPHYYEKESEALVYKQRAIELGVPEDKIIIEENSLTIADNVKSSLNLLQDLNLKYQRIIIVTAWFAQRRAWATLMKFTDLDTEFFNASPVTPGKYEKEIWFKHETPIKTLFNEYVKMKVSVALNTC